jgi:hypothetical protein
MKTQHALAFLLVALLLSGCDLLTRKSGNLFSDFDLNGTWQLADVREIEQFPARADNLAGRLLRDGWMLNFFPDYKYSALTKTSYQQGQFEVRGDVLILHPDGSKATDTLRLERRANEMFACKAHYNGQAFLAEMRKTAEPLKVVTQDPYHPALNRWRLPPGQSEDDAALRTRLRNHLEHNLALLEAGLEREARVWSWEYTPSCVQIYNGGLGLKSDERIEPEFFACFYNKDDAQRAIEQYKQLLRSGGSGGPGTGSWVRDDANLLKILLAGM